VFAFKRGAPRAETSRSPLWLWPAASSLAALTAGLWLASARFVVAGRAVLAG
jgi:hypothetical protein